MSPQSVAPPSIILFARSLGKYIVTRQQSASKVELSGNEPVSLAASPLRFTVVPSAAPAILPTALIFVRCALEMIMPGDTVRSPQKEVTT